MNHLNHRVLSSHIYFMCKSLEVIEKLKNSIPLVLISVFQRIRNQKESILVTIEEDRVGLSSKFLTLATLFFDKAI